MRKILLFVICNTLLSFFTFGQTAKIDGRVVDEKQKGLPQVMVLVNDADHRPVAYGTSDKDGKFEIDLPPDKQVVEVSLRLLGWTSVTISIDEWQNGAVIVLKEESIVLREVTVEARKIEEQGDTLNYQVSAFKQKQDRVIADVLAKMPGVEVKSDGSIKFQGKNINKFYIEGMDLMGSKYAQASQNLDARKVKSVQILKNHQPIRVLKDINFSDQAALNILLRDDAKSVWQGVLDIGIGASVEQSPKILRDSRVMLMNFTPRMQSISMLKTNNIGEDAKFDVRDLATMAKSLPEEAGLLSEIQVSTSGLERKRYWFNDSYLGTTNWLFKTGRGNNLRVQLHGYLDKSMVRQSRETTYLQIANRQTLSEEISAVNRDGEGKMEVKYEINNERLFLNTALQGYADLSRSNGISTLNGKRIEPSITSRRQWLAHDFNLIRSTSDGHKWSLSSLLRYNNLPGQLQTVTQEIEKVNFKSFDWDASASFGHKLWGIFVNYKLGVINKTQYLSATLGTKNLGQETYTGWTEYIEPRITYKRGTFTLDAMLRGSVLQQRLGEKSRNSFALDVRINTRHEVTPKLSLQGFVTHSNTPEDIKTATTTPLFTNYNMQSVGTGELASNSFTSIGGGVKYQDPIRGFFGNMNASYVHSRNMPIYSATIDNLIYAQSATGQRSSSNGYTVSGRLSQSTGWAMLTMALSGRYSHTNYQLIIGNDLTPFVGRNATLTFETYFHPIRDLSVELDSSMNYRGMGTKSSPQASKLTSYLHTLKVYYMPGNWTVTWENSLFHSSDKSVSRNHFSDLSLSYRADKYELGLSCHNIFGTKDYARRWFTSAVETSSITNLRGREIVVKASFSF